MSFLQGNLALLRRHDPELALRMEKLCRSGSRSVERAANGQPTLKVRGLALHSLRDPAREGESWAERSAAEHHLSAGSSVTVLGLGLGHHLKGLASLGIGGAVIEPDPDMVATALENLDLADLLDRFRIIAGVPVDTIRRRDGDLLARPVIPHAPSVRLHPDSLGTLSAYAEGVKAARGGGIRILLINPISGGSLPVARYCASALRGMGHIVTVFAAEAFASGMDFAGNYRFNSCRAAFRNELAAAVSRGVELMAKESRPDLIIALAQAPLLPETLAELKTMDITTAFWFVEDFRVLTYWRDVAPHYNHFFGIQQENFRSELKGVGVSSYHYLPMAASPEVHAPMELSPQELEEYGSPLSFVGAGYHNRCTLFRGLADYPFRIWGSDWPMTPPLDRLIQRGGKRIDTETCVTIFNASAVNLNLHSSLTHEGVVPDGDFVNPRTFEIASCNSFQLVDDRLLMGELFAEDEMARFSDLKQLREMIDHYLAHPDERSRFGKKGRERVLSEHTYEKRMEELLATIIGETPELAERVGSRRGESSRLQREIESQEGLRELLERLPRGAAPTLEGIYGALRSGEGELSRAERIFLAIRNVELKLD